MIVVGLLAVIELSWLVVGNRLLDGDRLLAAINRRPEKLLVSYASAYTLYPGHVALRGFMLRNQGTRSQLELRLDRVSALFNPLPLLWKTINIAWAEAEGAEFRMRSRPATIEQLQENAPTVPPITGLDYGSSLRDPVATTKAPRWGVSFTSASVDDIREVWIGGVRLRGPGRAHAGVKVGPGRWLSIVRGAVELPDLSIELGEGEPIQHARLAGGISILPYDYSLHPRLGFLPFASGRVQFEGRAGAGTPLLVYLFRRVEWLDFDGASSFETADLVVDRGVLQPGSRIVANTKSLSVKLFQFEARGEAVIELSAIKGPMGPRVDARVVVKRFGMGLEEAAPDAIFGQKLVASATVEGLVLGGAPPDVDVRIDLVNLQAPDITRANYLIPEGLGLALKRGSVQIDGYMRANTKRADGSGNLTVRAETIALEADDLEFSGSLDARIRIGGLDARQARFELSGTSARLSDFVLADGGSAETTGPQSGWWAEISIPSGVLDFRAREFFKGDVGFHLRDMRPILVFFLKGRPLPKFGRRLLEEEEIGGRGEIVYAGDRLEVHDLQVDSELIEVDAQLEIERRSVRGDLLAMYAIIGVGVGIENRDVEVQFLGARNWYLERKSTFWDRDRQEGEEGP